MQSIINLLQQLGFTKKAASIYLALLELGEAGARQITQKTGLKRTTVYNYLPEMLEKGLIQKSFKRGKQIFFVNNVVNLKREFEYRLSLAEKLLPELRLRQNVSPFRPKLSVYEGLGGAKDLYFDILESLKPGDVILSYGDFKNLFKYIPKDFMENYVAERVRRKIRARMIMPYSEQALELKKMEVKTLRQIKIVNDQIWDFNADTEIYSNKVALISYTENFIGVIIESQEISQMQKMVFEIMWNALI